MNGLWQGACTYLFVFAALQVRMRNLQEHSGDRTQHEKQRNMCLGLKPFCAGAMEGVNPKGSAGDEEPRQFTVSGHHDRKPVRSRRCAAGAFLTGGTFRVHPLHRRLHRTALTQGTCSFAFHAAFPSPGRSWRFLIRTWSAAKTNKYVHAPRQSPFMHPATFADNQSDSHPRRRSLHDSAHPLEQHTFGGQFRPH